MVCSTPASSSPTPHEADPPPANTWALWAPLSDAGEALFNLATAAMCPEAAHAGGAGPAAAAADTKSNGAGAGASAKAADKATRPWATPRPDPPLAAAYTAATPAAPAPTSPSTTRTGTIPTSAPGPGAPTPPARPPSPAVPPSLTGLAASHPYSTAFLLGAALSASILAGAAAGRVAMGRVGQRAAAAAGPGPAAGAPAGAAPLATIGGGTSASAAAARKPGSNGAIPASPIALTMAEYDARIGRVEALAREMTREQKAFADTVVGRMLPGIEGRLAGIEAGLSPQAQAQLHLDDVEEQMGEVLRELRELREGRDMEPWGADARAWAASQESSAEADERIREQLGLVQDMLETATADKLTKTDFENLLRTMLAGLGDNIPVTRLEQLEQSAIGKLDKLETELQAIRSRLGPVGAVEAAGGERSAAAAAAERPANAERERHAKLPAAHAPHAVPSLNDLANEGLREHHAQAHAEPVAAGITNGAPGGGTVPHLQPATAVASANESAEREPAPAPDLTKRATAQWPTPSLPPHVQGAPAAWPDANESHSAPTGRPAPPRPAMEPHPAAAWPNTMESHGATSAPAPPPLAPDASTPAGPRPTPRHPPPPPHPHPRLPSLPPSLRAQQPEVLDVDDSGQWSFRLRGLPQATAAAAAAVAGAKEQMVVLSHAWEESECAPGYQFKSRGSIALGPFTTLVIYTSPTEVDMVLVDGAWWRCSREGDVYTIRERVASAGGNAGRLAQTC